MKDKRWSDFRRRADFAPQTVYLHRTRNWEYIPVHPFGNETEILSSLKLCPEQCFFADAWWGIEGDATLLESSTVKASGRPAGLYAHYFKNELKRICLVAIFDADYVTRTAFEDAMTKFADAGFPNDARFKLKSDDSWIRI